MDKVHSDLSTYEEFVNALADNHAHFDSFIIRDKEVLSPKYVCDTPEILTDLGFADKVVYHAQHLKDHMHPRDMEHEHGHSGTKEELLALPELLKRPIAIITDKDRPSTEGKTYRALTMLAVQREAVGEEKYYLIGIQPRDDCIGALDQYQAAKITTFLSIGAEEFHERLNVALANYQKPGSAATLNENLQHSLLYFDERQKGFLDPEFAVMGLYTQKSMSKCVLPYVSNITNHSADAAEMKKRIKDAVYLELEREFENKIDSQRTRFPLLSSAFEVLNDRSNSSLDEVSKARFIVNKTCSKSKDPIAQKAVQKADHRFAEVYMSRMICGGKEAYIENAVQTVARLDALDQSDIKTMYDVIDQIEEGAKIKFSEISQADPVVKAAMLINQDFMKDLRARVSEVSLQKEEIVQELEDRRNNDGRDWDD